VPGSFVGTVVIWSFVYLRALAEMEAAGILSDVRVRVVTGPEEYLFGEEKALLEVIEGNEPLPRWLPPYIHGLYATSPQLGWQSHEPEPGHHGAHDTNPTLVNNVETLANVPGILTQAPNGSDRGVPQTRRAPSYAP